MSTFVTTTASFSKYLSDIRETQPMGSAELKQMFKVYSLTKSKLVKDKIIAANMRFVLKVAIHYRNSGVPISDLVSEGTIGLIKAVENYDYTQGTTFLTFSVYWIRAYISYAITKYKNMIHIPANRALEIGKARRGEVKISDKAAQLEEFNNMVNIDSKINEDDRSYNEVLFDHKDDIDESFDVSDVIADMLKTLPDKEKYVVKEIYGIDTDKPHGLREVGTAIGYSHARIRQLRDQALRRIRKYTNEDFMREAKEAICA